MNNYQTIDVSYIRPSRTIETILLKNDSKERILYIYNFEGWHFRIFNNIVDIIDFFDDKFETKISFESEKELDEFLKKVNLDNKIFINKTIN